MARVTVEDCILQVPNRFELVMMAAQRARDISTGTPLLVERDNDKNPVVALREIADQLVDFKQLEDSLIQTQQKYVARDEQEEDQPEFDALEGELEASARMAAESLGQTPSASAAEDESPAADESPAEAEASGSGDESGEQGGPSLEELAEREAEAEAEAQREESENED